MADNANITTSTIKEYEKSQLIRLADIFVFTPIIVYASFQKELPIWLRISLAVMGGTTLFYNTRNYLKNRNAEQQ